MSVGRLIAVLAMCAIGSACGDLDVVTAAYATKAEAEAAGAIAKGWVPAGIPSASYEIREAHDVDTNRRWGLFNFAPAQSSELRAMLQPTPAAVEGMRSDIPARIEWWPPLLRGEMDPARLKDAGLEAYGAADGTLILLVNWAQGRAYYWSVRENQGLAGT